MSSVVPDGWSKNTINECCEILDSQRVPVNSEERAKRKGDYPYYGANGVQGYIDDYIFEGDAILLAEDGGNFDQYADRPIAQWVTGKFWVNNHAHILRAKDNATDKWIFYSLVHKNILKNINGGTRAKLNQSDLKEIEILLSPLPEQKKIASILTSVDEVIENTQKQIDKLQDLKKATMNELLTKGIGHTEFKDSELGRIPKSWEVKKLGVFAKVKGGKRLPKGEQFSETMTEYPYIRVSDFENQGINKTRLKYVSGRVRESIKGYVISSKDLYISIAGSIGIVGTIPDELSGSLLTENAAKIVLESNVITRDFLKCNLSSEIAQSQFRQEKGTGGGVPKLALFRIEETLVALPKIDEQLQISSTIASLDKAISDVDSKLSQTQSLKKSLMQDLLTGKVRVTVN